MANSLLRIGIAGCGQAARIHVERLLKEPDVKIVGCADALRESAQALAASIAETSGESPAVFGDLRGLLDQRPDAVAIFTPHLLHYRQAMDALQAGVHVFIEKPLSTNAQEADDVVNLARGRKLKVAVGHQYRLRPSLVEARKRLAADAVGPLRLVTAALAQPWLARQQERGGESSWRFDPKMAGGGLLADAGDHLVDALLWTTGRPALEVFAVQSRLPSGLDVVTAAAIRLEGDVAATLALSGVSRGSLFELNFFGERGRIHATDALLEVDPGDGSPVRRVDLPEAAESVDANFLAALRGLGPLSCSAEDALDTVRLSEAVARSAATGQVVPLI
ncbi:Gfo/Idh/MocA family protein [Paludisphaera mucosa]|uniref:Gfo/Idh/MocA family oxidoreductase n=1 Tax=Paludisphaera mucosa TaxID=3030827 RepID=A0ABT6FHU9_9BACT|nr:Gfo/Idh/MocA family oxidoreductase [Paludisphaera mucosa]MDG3007112.1 Gfo/Idh/MocA family oxidoreductase [Paludisphaera mucosa]